MFAFLAMKYVLLVTAVLILCSLHGALGIICKECTPDEKTFKACDKAEQLTEVDCDNETFPFNVTEGTKYDSCATTTIVVSLAGNKLMSYVMSCAVKANSSNPSVVNCSLIEDYVCGDARIRAAASNLYTINSCGAACCLENSCNVHPTAAPATATASATTTASNTTAENGASEVQQSCLGLLLVLLAMNVVMEKAAF